MNMHQRGFTLVEILVATVVFAIFMVGMLNLLDTSTKVSELENSLADAQENVRFATYHIMRTARMLGGATMPVATDVAGSDRWVTAELKSNASGTVAIPGYGNVTVKSGSDVLTLRGFFEVSPFFANPTNVKVDTNTIRIDEYDASDPPQRKNEFAGFTPAAFNGRGIVFMGEGSYCVGRIDSGSDFTDEGATDNELLINHTEDPAFWETLNTTWPYPPSFQIYRVGVLESYTYFVSPDNVLRRVRIAGDNPRAEPVAINIGGLQVAFGIDADNNGTIEEGEWVDDPAGPADLVGSEVQSMRIVVLGRTRVTVPDWTEPESTFAVFDGDSQNMDRSAKWRRMDVEVNLRNYKF